MYRSEKSKVKSDLQSLCMDLSAVCIPAAVSAPFSEEDGWGCLFAIRAGWASSPSLPQKKSITHHRDQWPTFTRSPKCSSPLLNFSFSLHLCEECTAGGYHHASSRFIVFYMSTSAPCPKEEVEGKNLAESSRGISGTHQSHLQSNRINQAQLTAQL